MDDVEGNTSDVLGYSKNIDSDYETNLQHELEEILNYESEDEEEDDDPLVIDDDCILFEDDLENLEQNNIQFNDADITSLFKYNNKNILHLTAEEEDVIKECTDPALQRCLVQNRLKMMQLRELHAKLLAVQNNCSFAIEKEREMTETQTKTCVVFNPKTYIWKLGTPYFKDQLCYGAPPNVDFINKQQNSEYSITKFSEGRRWVDEDQMILYNSIKASYFKYYVSELEQQIRNVKRKMKNETDTNHMQELEKQLETLQKELEELQSGRPYKTPPYKSDIGIDWLKIANTDLKGQHTIYECKAMWNIYLHPYINKKDWSLEENERIQLLAKEHGYQDWDLIADKLSTNRSGYLVCMHYFSKLCEKFKRERFLPEEDDYLLEVIENCRLGSYIPWSTVARYFEDRSKTQVYHRYKYYLSCKDIVKKGTFTEAEDTLIIYLVQKFGRDYSKISAFMPHRTAIQLRNRYANYLEKLNINRGNYSLLDDAKILDYVKVHGLKKWSTLAKQLKRTRAHVRQRYLTLKKWIDKDPQLKLQDVPRRKQNFLSDFQSKRYERLPEILKKLEKYEGVPDLHVIERLINKEKEKVVSTEKKWRIFTNNKRNSFTPADHNLVEFFKGTCKLQRESKPISQETVVDSAQRVLKILDLLGMDINLLRNAEVEENTILSSNECEILESVKEILKNDTQLDLGECSSTEPTPGTSQSNTNPPLKTSDNQVKSLLPPTVNTLLGLRGLMVKYEVHKEETNETFMSNVKLDSTKTALEDPTVWRIEQNLLQLDEHARTAVQNQRSKFFDRFRALFEWPGVMSTYFPEDLDKEDEEEQEPEPAVETTEAEKPAKVGRPPKKSYPKVSKMIEARKRKQSAITSNDESNNSSTNTGEPDVDNQSETINPGTSSTQLVEHEGNAEQPKVKKKKGRRSVKTIAEYPIQYVPRRGKVKNTTINEELVNVDLPSSSDQQKNTSPKLPHQKVINISDLKLMTANVPLINRNVLLKLDHLRSSKKIVVLDKPIFENCTLIGTTKTNSNIRINQNSNCDIVQNQKLDNVTCSSADLQASMHMESSPIKYENYSASQPFINKNTTEKIEELDDSKHPIKLNSMFEVEQNQSQLSSIKQIEELIEEDMEMEFTEIDDAFEEDLVRLELESNAAIECDGKKSKIGKREKGIRNEAVPFTIGKNKIVNTYSKKK